MALILGDEPTTVPKASGAGFLTIAVLLTQMTFAASTGYAAGGDRITATTDFQHRRKVL